MNTHKPLSVVVRPDGVLEISIGVDTLAFAALRSDFAWDLANPDGRHLLSPHDRFSITDPVGFAEDVRSEILEGAEDGSSLLTRMLDAATEQAIDQGSEHFHDKQDGA